MDQILLHVNKYFHSTAYYITRRLSISATVCANNSQKRQEILFPKNPNKSSSLTLLPDYTFLDGRITPLGANQKKRLLKHRELANKIVMLSKEMDFALDRYNRIQEEQKQEKAVLLNSKLKPKGHLLLSMNKQS
ncbi:39S ribosomal protein L52, mitochondrial [Sabethes cyaneus]|uniref:39S ribosomal protein L52, mitochondrial n=1 Tax=Sabethes cyaneus TaxID=53552 RepID=UPI00237DD79A|nr:39S ribosomal protein L52, mitochondrial [Sabethes cyaneus]